LITSTSRQRSRGCGATAAQRGCRRSKPTLRNYTFGAPERFKNARLDILLIVRIDQYSQRSRWKLGAPCASRISTRTSTCWVPSASSRSMVQRGGGSLRLGRRGRLRRARRVPRARGVSSIPPSPYRVSKLAAERYLHHYWTQYGISYAALRYANVYRPRQGPHRGEARAGAIFCGNLAASRVSKINGSGSRPVTPSTSETSLAPTSSPWKARGSFRGVQRRHRASRPA
jgi:hypothetical protein